MAADGRRNEGQVGGMYGVTRVGLNSGLDATVAGRQRGRRGNLGGTRSGWRSRSWRSFAGDKPRSVRAECIEMSTAPIPYAFGSGENQQSRLIAQARGHEPEARWLLAARGVGLGWRAADIGCGASTSPFSSAAKNSHVAIARFRSSHRRTHVGFRTNAATIIPARGREVPI